MPRISHLPEVDELVDDEVYEESLTQKSNLSLQDISARLLAKLPELRSEIDVSKILNVRGMSVETAIENIVVLLQESDDDKLRKDLLFEILDLHGVRKTQTQDNPSINLIIQDGNVKVQQVLLPHRD